MEVYEIRPVLTSLYFRYIFNLTQPTFQYCSAILMLWRLDLMDLMRSYKVRLHQWTNFIGACNILNDLQLLPLTDLS